jgi:hypothetical protein
MIQTMINPQLRMSWHANTRLPFKPVQHGESKRWTRKRRRGEAAATLTRSTHAPLPQRAHAQRAALAPVTLPSPPAGRGPMHQGWELHIWVPTWLRNATTTCIDCVGRVSPVRQCDMRSNHGMQVGWVSPVLTAEHKNVHCSHAATFTHPPRESHR